mmetsp:Transcript_24013/g.58095  ORF Transcript_24013/g.58095 Transcript_24013/m.58095 type:complete len:970 (+) Transcript_24013:226-3135(+)
MPPKSTDQTGSHFENSKLSKNQKELVLRIAEYRECDPDEALVFCQKYMFEMEDLEQDDRRKLEQWNTVPNKRLQRKKKKEEREKNASRGRGRGRGRVGRGRGRGRSSDFQGRGRRGGSVRGRGGARGDRGGRGRGRGRSMGPRNNANKENNPKTQDSATKPTEKSDKSDWPGQQTRRPTNPSFNPNWGKPKAPVATEAEVAPAVTEPEPDPWQEPTKADTKHFEQKKDSSDDWDATAATQQEQEVAAATEPEPVQDTEQEPEPTSEAITSFSAVTQSAWDDEQKSNSEKAWGGTWGPSTAPSNVQSSQTETSAAEASSNWDGAKKQPAQAETNNTETTSNWNSSTKNTTSAPQRKPRGPRVKNPMKDSLGNGVNRVGPGRYPSTSKWRRKDRSNEQQKVALDALQSQDPAVSKTTNEMLDSAQSGMGKLSVADSSKSSDPNVILPSYVTNNQESDSMVFGLGADPAREQFMRPQNNGDIFGETSTIPTQMGNFPAQQQQMQDAKLSAMQSTTQASSMPQQNTPLAEQSSMPQTQNSSAPSTAPDTTQGGNMQHMTMPSEIQQQPANVQSDAQPGGSIHTTQSVQNSMQMPRPDARSLDHTMNMYSPHGYAAPNMPPQYGMPNDRNFYEQSPATQMPQPGFYEYSQLQQQQLQQQQLPQGRQQQRGRGMHKNQGKKGLDSMKDAKKLQQGQPNEKGRNKQPRMQKGGYMPRGYNKHNQGGNMKQNFSKNGFSQKQRQGMQPQPFNQQYMGAPPVQYQNHPMPYYHNYNYAYYQNAQFGQPGYGRSPYYPAPNQFANYGPAGFHNPQAQGYGGEEHYQDGKTGYQSQQVPVQRGQPNQGQMPQQQPQQQHHMPNEPEPHSGFSQHLNGPKHTGPQVDSRVQASQFDNAPWTTSQLSAPSTHQSTKIGEDSHGKQTGNPMLNSGPSPSNYRAAPTNFYMHHSGFPEQQIPQQQQQIHQPGYWGGSTGGSSVQ